MVYTEIKEKNGSKYYYRVKNVREGEKFRKKRVYLGKNLSKKQLSKKGMEADKELMVLSSLLNKSEEKFLENLKEKFRKQPKENLKNRYEAFTSFFTYDSNAIEGNSLTLDETSFLLFENLVPSSKSLREINETLNHKKAFDYMFNYRGDINKKFILHLHKLVVKETLRKDLNSQIGVYRKVQVYIRGKDWMPPKPSKIPNEMKSLLSWYSKNKKKLHPLILASYFHTAFETVHPFVDGNGRVGRLLMNFILHKNKFPMINIPSKTKFNYYDALHEAQVEGNLKPFVDLCLDIYGKAKLLF